MLWGQEEAYKEMITNLRGISSDSISALPINWGAPGLHSGHACPAPIIQLCPAPVIKFSHPNWVAIWKWSLANVHGPCWPPKYFRKGIEWLWIGWAKTGTGTILRIYPLNLPLAAPVPKLQHSDLLVWFKPLCSVRLLWDWGTSLLWGFGLVFLKSTQWFNCEPAFLPARGPSFCLPAGNTCGGFSQLWRSSAPVWTWTRLSQISPKTLFSCTPFYWALIKALTSLSQICTSFQWNICAKNPAEMENSEIQVPFLIMIRFL